MTQVTLVVLNWNRPDLTIDCLKSVKGLKAKNIKLNVLVVDNNSSDDSVERISSFSEKQKSLDIKLISNKDNFGFAKGNNIGIKQALKGGADYVMILNNDTVLDADLLENLLAAAHNSENFAVLTPKIYFAPGYEFHKKRYKKRDLGRVIWAVGGEIDWSNVYATNRGVDRVDEGQFNETKEVDFASGACMLIKSNFLLEANGFDEKFFMYLEDTDLCMRIRRQGGKIVYVHNAEIWHKIAQSSRIGSSLNDYFITRNRLLFGLRYAPLRSKIALLRESVRFLFSGRPEQKLGVKDFYLGKLGKGSLERVA